MKLTKPQIQSLYQKWQIDNQNLSFLKFRRTVGPMVADDAAVVHWGNMWLVIEADGHVHT
jgi:hypothetical protein|tara:strand:+ start:1909 stop:2088 length:180 start_codon:yes stop_codon:yes gene_type:complete